MSKFTGGKWEVDVIYGDHYVVFTNDRIVADNRIVADCFGSNANARLIAAAPEMYKLLTAVANYKPDIIWDVVSHAKELLLRIDGEEAANE